MALKTLRTSGTGDYTTIAAWRDSLPATLTEDEILECYNDAGGAHSEGQVNFASITTSSGAQIIIRAATGHEYDYRTNTGFRWEGSQSWGALGITGSLDFITIEKIGIINTHPTASDIWQDGHVTFKRCYFECKSTHGSSEGVKAHSGLIESCVIKGGNDTGVAGGDGVYKGSDTDHLVVRGCTILGFNDAFGNAGTGDGNIHVENCLVWDCTDSYDVASKIDAANSFNNASFEGATVTPIGSNPYSSNIVAGDFVDEVNNDFSLPQGHALNTAGGNPGAAYEDYSGNLQTGTFSIGAHVYASGNTAPTNTNNIETVGIEGEDVVLSQSDLEWTDSEEAAPQLPFTVKKTPLYGVLKRLGVPLAVNDTFTQDDINSGNIEYFCNTALPEFDFFIYDIGDGTDTVFGQLYVFQLVKRIPDTHPIATQTKLTWQVLPGGTIDAVQDSGLHAGFGGSNAGIRTAWSGGCKYRNWTLIHGGGHGDSHDNGFYGYDLENPSSGWQYLGGRSVNADIIDTTGGAYNSDNRPQSSHTYDSLIGLPAQGYVMNVGLIGPGSDSGSYEFVEKFVPSSSDWELPSTLPDLPVAGMPKGSMVRTADDVIWLLPKSTVTTNRVCSIKHGEGSWTQHGSFAVMPSATGFTTAVLCPNKQKAFLFGDNSTHTATIKALVFDLSSGHGSTSTISPTDITSSLTGDTDIVLNHVAPAAFYHKGKIYLHGKTSSNADVYEFDPDTYAITKLTLDISNAVTPEVGQANGTYHAFNWFPEYGALVGVHSTTGNTYAFKLDDSFVSAPEGTADLAAGSSITAQGQKQGLGIVGINVGATLTADASKAAFNTVSIGVGSSISTSGTKQGFNSVSLDANTSISAVGVKNAIGSVSVNAIASITASGAPLGSGSGYAHLNSVAQITAQGQKESGGYVDSVSGSSISALGFKSALGGATLSAIGSISVAGIKEVVGSGEGVAHLSAGSLINAAGRKHAFGVASLGSGSAVSVNGGIALMMDIDLELIEIISATQPLYISSNYTIN